MKTPTTLYCHDCGSSIRKEIAFYDLEQDNDVKIMCLSCYKDHRGLQEIRKKRRQKEEEVTLQPRSIARFVADFQKENPSVPLNEHNIQKAFKQYEEQRANTSRLDVSKFEDLTTSIERAKQKTADKEQQRLLEKRASLAQKRTHIMKTFNEGFIGMSTVKPKIEEWLYDIEGFMVLKEKSTLKMENPPMHTLITGNPGVGKTILAQKMKDILFEAGFIEHDKLTMVKAEDIVDRYVGHTARNTKEKIQEALGGVFFLDEAYRLTEGFSGEKGNFGLEALETIMGYMESSDIVFIFAGYEDKMQAFLEANDGLPSRIKHHFHLNDYTLEELTAIATKQLRDKNYVIENAVIDILKYHIKQNMRQGTLKGNARTVSTYIEDIIRKHRKRITEDATVTHFEEIISSDVESVFQKENLEQEGLQTLFLETKGQIESLVGLNQVKQQVETLANHQYIQQRKRTLGLPVQMESHHMLLLGPAGVGKTTIARLMGQLFRGIGILANGHFVEASKESLTSGTSIPKTVKSLVNKSMGGILFIDEAYTLANDAKGKEALDALVPYLENKRDEFICIMAGYERDMGLLFRMNEGLSSRFPHQFHFEDYNAKELTQLFTLMRQSYTLNCEEGFLESCMKDALELGQTSGNGRWVRNLFEQTLMEQSNRLFREEIDGMTLSKEQMLTIEQKDIEKAFEKLSATKNTVVNKQLQQVL